MGPKLTAGIPGLMVKDPPEKTTMDTERLPMCRTVLRSTVAKPQHLFIQDSREVNVLTLCDMTMRKGSGTK